MPEKSMAQAWSTGTCFLRTGLQSLQLLPCSGNDVTWELMVGLNDIN